MLHSVVLNLAAVLAAAPGAHCDCDRDRLSTLEARVDALERVVVPPLEAPKPRRHALEIWTDRLIPLVVDGRQIGDPRRAMIEAGQIQRHDRLPLKPSGTILLGSASDPLSVAIHYDVSGARVSYSINAKPWALVRQNRVLVGETPMSEVAAAGTTALEFDHPTHGRLSVRLRIVEAVPGS